MQVVGTTAYVADYGAGLQILDVSNPAVVVRLGGSDTVGEAQGLDVVGTTAYVAVGSCGLAVLELRDRFTQSITFPGITGVSITDLPVRLDATASSGLPVTFTVVSGPGNIEGNVLSWTGPGTIIVRAEQPGNDLFAPAPPVERACVVTTPPSNAVLVGAWLATQYPAVPEGQRSIQSDPDGDGVPNGLECLLGGNPTVPEPDSGRLPSGTVAMDAQGQRVWTVTFSLGPDVPAGLAWSVEQTDDPARPSWWPLPATAVSREGRLVILTLPAVETSRFLRLRLD